MNIPFDIVKGKGPIIFDPPSTTADVEQVREFIPEESVPYVGEALKILRKEVFFFSLFCFLCLMSSGKYGRYKNHSTLIIVFYYLKRIALFGRIKCEPKFSSKLKEERSRFRTSGENGRSLESETGEDLRKIRLSWQYTFWSILPWKSSNLVIIWRIKGAQCRSQANRHV